MNNKTIETSNLICESEKTAQILGSIFLAQDCQPLDLTTLESRNVIIYHEQPND